MTIRCVCLATLALGCTFVHQSRAQEESTDLATVLLSRLTESLQVQAAEEQRLSVLSAPIVIPSTPTPAAEPGEDDALEYLWSIPTFNDDGQVEFTSDRVSQQIRTYFDDTSEFELGTLRLDANARQRLLAAREILFEDPQERQTRTSAFDRYREWQRNRRALLGQLGEATTNAARLALNQELSILDEDYLLLGEKAQVEAAIEVVNRYTTEAPLFSAQVEQLLEVTTNESESQRRTAFLEQLASPAAWVRLSMDSESAPLPTHVTLTVSEDGEEESEFRLPLSGLSFEVIALPVEQSIRSINVLGNRAWRRRDGTLLSDGKLESSPDEVLPGYVERAFVLRNLEIVTDANDTEYVRFASILSRETAITSGTIVLQSEEVGPIFALPGHLYISHPMVVGVIVSATPAAPQPLPDLVWE